MSPFLTLYGSISKPETNLLDGTQICNFFSNLDQDSKVLLLLLGGLPLLLGGLPLLLGGLPLPFDNMMAILIKRFMSSAIRKIYKLHLNRLRELETRWLKDKCKSILNFIVISKFFNLGLFFSFSNLIFLTCKTRNV